MPEVLGISVRGASHIQSGLECQDSNKYVICENGFIILSVADGHGSKNCPFSKTGSDLATQAFCSTMTKYLNGFGDSTEQLLTFLNREGETKVAQDIELEWKALVEEAHVNAERDCPVDENGEPDKVLMYAQYGTTLLGLLLCDDFLFAFQIGDGDMVFATKEHVYPVIIGDKILGVETHSLSRTNAWKKALSVVRRINPEETRPNMYLLSTDGFANSHKNDEEFYKTCTDYLTMLEQYGSEAVSENLESWLSETSALGCGDDITVLIAYYPSENAGAHEEEQDDHGSGECTALSAEKCDDSCASYVQEEDVGPEEGNNNVGFDVAEEDAFSQETVDDPEPEGDCGSSCVDLEQSVGMIPEAEAEPSECCDVALTSPGYTSQKAVDESESKDDSSTQCGDFATPCNTPPKVENETSENEDVIASPSESTEND